MILKIPTLFEAACEMMTISRGSRPKSILQMVLIILNAPTLNIKVN